MPNERVYDVGERYEKKVAIICLKAIFQYLLTRTGVNCENSSVSQLPTKI
jgi:hypothetical protein